MRTAAKEFFKKVLSRMGYEIRHLRKSESNPYVAQHKLLTGMGIDRPTVLDLGANEGQTIALYKSFFPEAKLYCFEPFPDTFERLTKAWGSDPHVKLFQKAVTDTTGEKEFHVTRYPTTHSLLPRPGEGRQYFPDMAGDSGKTIKVPTVSVDDFVQEQGIDRVDVIKMDIQGGEIMALRGAERTLREGGPSLIYMESPFIAHYEGEGLFYHSCQILADYGYSVYDLFYLYRGDTSGQLRYCEAVFASPTLREEVIDRFPNEPGVGSPFKLRQ